MFGVLAVMAPKHQQAWGQHPGYKTPCTPSRACSHWPCSAAVVGTAWWDIKDVEPQRC